MSNIPLISILMGIFNCAETLPEAIESILAQTYTNWELILCDDASSDNTFAVAQKYVQKYPDKIKLIKNPHNCGLNKTLNNCLALAKGSYIARMDGDDICSPNRFEKELAFLENHKEFDIVSTNMEYFDDNGVFGSCKAIEYPSKKDIVKNTPFCHAPCMVRKRAFDMVGGYAERKILMRMEDYDLWIRMYEKGLKGYNIQEVLYSMRDDRNAYKRRKFRYRINEAYVKISAVKKLKLNPLYAVFAIRPIIVGILPKPVYMILHKGRMR